MLAHLVADYPLQPDRLVAAKKRLPGLSIHIAIHWVTMTLFTWSVRAIVWPYVLAIALMHFGIDYFKVLLGRKRPQWVIGPYLLDQPLHWISLILAGMWMVRSTDLPVWQVLSPWWVYGIGLLIATHIWFVTERVLNYRDKKMVAQVQKSEWPRMGARLLLYTFLVPAQLIGLLLALVAFAVTAYLYQRFDYRRRWLTIDLSISVISALIALVILALF